MGFSFYIKLLQFIDRITFLLFAQNKLRLLEEDNSSLEKLGITDNHAVLIEGLSQQQSNCLKELWKIDDMFSNKPVIVSKELVVMLRVPSQ